MGPEVNRVGVQAPLLWYHPTTPLGDVKCGGEPPCISKASACLEGSVHKHFTNHGIPLDDSEGPVHSTHVHGATLPLLGLDQDVNCVCIGT